MDMNQPIHTHQYYTRLAIMTVLSYVFMYILMFAMTNTPGDLIPNLNQFYMAGLMTAPMVVLEVGLMNMMYPDKKLNAGIIAASIVLGIVFFVLIRQQITISDRQLLKSMIPHHSGAILMCEQASLDDAEVEQLCQGIISSQQQEIDEMRKMLGEVDD